MDSIRRVGGTTADRHGVGAESDAATATLVVGAMSVSVRWAAVTHPGLVRTANQDRFAVGRHLFAVCDGMGGHLAGELASAIACEAVLGVETGKAPTVAELVDTVAVANEAILRAGAADEGLAGMGTTLVAIGLTDNGGEATWTALNVGDSRLYMSDGTTPRLVSHDHSVVQELLDAGALTEVEARDHVERHVVTRALGSLEAPAADVWLLPPRPGDRLLLTSDGAHGELAEQDIEAALSRPTPAECCSVVLELALAQGGRDNITALAVFVDAVGGPHTDLVDEATTPRSQVSSARSEDSLITQVPVT